MENQEPKLLSDYSDEEKGAYLAAIASVASADREASAEEIEFLTLLAQSADISPAMQQEVIIVAKDPSNINVQKCLAVLKDSELRFSFITDIMSFAQADGKLDAQEQSVIQQMAQYLQINQQQFSALQQFVHKAGEAEKQGQNPTDQSFLQNSGTAQAFGQSGIPMGSIMKGLLGVVAPMVISGMLSRRRGGMMGGVGAGMGGGLLGGLLGSVMSGSMGTMGGMGGMSRGGGLGSLMGVLGGLGRQQGYNRGGLGSILGSVLGGSRGTSW